MIIEIHILQLLAVYFMVILMYESIKYQVVKRRR